MTTYETIYKDVYKLHAKFGRVPLQQRGDYYWVWLADEIGAYVKAHNDTFTVALLAAVADELERERRTES